MKMGFKLLIVLIIILSVISCTGKKQQQLYIFNWTDYIDPVLIAEFEKANDCKIVYDTYNSNENMLTKLLTTQSAYDIVVPSGDHVSILQSQGVLEPLDKTKLKNYANIDTLILNKAQQFDEGNKYSIPYFWGTAGFIYNKKKLSDAEMKSPSWMLIADAKFAKNKAITMLDDEREVIGAALIYNGYDPNILTDDTIAKARATLLQWDKNVSQYDSDSFKNEIQDGSVWMAQAYNGDALQVMKENSDVGFTLPKEGSTLWIDFLVIPAKAENKELAYKFIDFLLEKNNAMKNTMFVQYATPNKAAYELLPPEVKNNQLIYPSPEYLQKCYLLKNIGNEVKKVDSIWQEIRNN